MRKILICLIGLILSCNIGFAAQKGGSSVTSNDSRYVQVAGDTMTGSLTLSAGSLHIEAGKLGIGTPEAVTGLHVGTGANSHSLTSTNDAFVSGKLEVNSSLFVDGTLYPYGAIQFDGSFTNGGLQNYADDGLKFIIGQAVNRNVIILDSANANKDHDHDTLSAHPTLFIQSIADPDDDNTQWVSLTHASTEAQIDTGVGNIAFLATIESGAYEFTEDAGFVTAMDMSVSATPGSGTQESYTFKIDGESFMKMYSEADGSGGITDESVRVYKPIAFIPSTDQTVASDEAINPDAAYVRVVGSTADALLDTAPSISDGTTDGQKVIIQGTNDSNIVTIADNTNIQLSGGTNFSMGKGDILEAIWDEAESDWLEIGRSDN